MWTGNGYHLYQPIQPIGGEVLERLETFYDFLPYLNGIDLTSEFLRFSERFLSNGKSDSNHNPAIKSCLLTIAGTINTKNNSEVKIIQKWDGNRPPIQYITQYFMSHLIQRRINTINRRKLKSNKSIKEPNYDLNEIGWIEDLLRLPLDDYRYFCLWKILIPYLVNVKGIEA